MKAMNSGFNLQSVRARTRAAERNERSKIRGVIPEVIPENHEPEKMPCESVILKSLLENMELVRIGSRLRIVIPEILLGCVWWSVIQMFPPTILHSSIVEKKPCGFELLALCYLSPLLVAGHPAAENFIASRTGLLLSRLGLLIAVSSHFASSYMLRLSLSFAGNGFAPLVLSRLWLTNDPLDRSRKIYLHMLGYLLLLVLRVHWLTLDPIFTSTAICCTAIITGVACSVYLFYADKLCSLDHQSCKRKEGLRTFAWRSLVVAMAFGALLFLTRWLFGELSVAGMLTSSTPSSVVLSSFQEGLAIMAALATGLAVLSDKRQLIGHPVWYLVGLGSGQAFCHHSFAGGCVLAVFCMSMWPQLLELLLCHSSAPTLSLGMLTCFVLTLLSALVTGHDVMPGLTLLFNGRPAILVTLSIALVIVGLQKYWKTGKDAVPVFKPQRRRNSRSSQVSFFGSVWRRLSTISEVSSTEENSDDDAFEKEPVNAEVNLNYDFPLFKEEEGKRFLSLVQKASFVLFLASFVGHVMQVNTIPAPPNKAHNQHVTFAVWSANFGYSTDGTIDLWRTAALLNSTGADVVAMADCDTFYPFFGSYNVVQWLAKTLNMFPDCTSTESTGLGVISRHYIINSSHQLFHDKEGLHAAVKVTAEVFGHLVDYVFVKPRYHWDRHANCSQLHVQNLSRIVNDSQNSRAVLVHHTFCNYSSFLSRGWKHIVQPHSGTQVNVLYRNLIRTSYLNTGQLMLAQFVVSGFDNEPDNDREVFAPGYQHSGSDWAHFLDRYYRHLQYNVVKYFVQTESKINL